MILLNNRRVPITKFPNGENLIKIEDLKIHNETNEITVKFEDNSDILNLVFLAKFLDNQTFAKSKILNIEYFPYERMDRSKNQTVFTLKYVCELINDLNFEVVYISEPHSDVVTALLNKVCPLSYIPNLIDTCMEENELDFSTDIIYYPDTTAEKRQGESTWFRYHLTGLKHRDFATGNITGLELIGDTYLDFNDRKAIMVDDLCSKGTTFIKGAEKLKELGIEKVFLIVNHCENSIFQGDIFKTDLIDKVYTTNSILIEEIWNSKAQIQNNRLFVRDVIGEIK